MATRPPATHEIIAIVADLHLADGHEDPFTEDQRLADTLARLVSRAGDRRLRLVLLGDTFDFPAVTLPGQPPTPATRPSEATQKLDRILDAHPLVLKGLRRLVEAGHRIDLVAGNHDMELLFPGVQALLRDALGGETGSIGIHPWMLYLPGVLYAEHGQQLHDFNRFPDLVVTPPDQRDRLRVPAGSYLDALVHLSTRQRGASRRALAGQAARMSLGLLGGLTWLAQAERRRARRERQLAAIPVAGLPAAAVVALDRVGAATPGSIARRAVALAVGRLRRASRPPALPYMRAGAAEVHRALSSQGLAVPFYVFGHTHVAADAPVSDDPQDTARYLNPGTWSSLGCRGDASDQRFGVVVVDQVPGGEPTAAVVRPV